MEKTLNFSPYEQEQYNSIVEWEQKEPSLVSIAINTVLTPVTSVLTKIVSPKVVEGALLGSYKLAQSLTDSQDIIRDAKVQDISELRTKDLELSDKLADEVRTWAIAAAGTEGAAMGVTGFAGLAVDIPALITLAIRTIHKTALCYGYKNDSDEDFLKVISIVSAASANTLKEKTTSVFVLRGLTTSLTKGFWQRLIGKKTAFDVIAKTVKTLTKQVGINLTKRKVGQIAPVFGAVVGASMNAAYINDIARVAKMAYQRQWLAENGKIVFDEAEFVEGDMVD